MRRPSRSSARTVAFAAAFCALGIAPGCGRETFELLPDATFSTAGSGSTAGTTHAGGAGFGGSSAAPGNAGVSGAGKAGAAGTGGRMGSSPPTCLGEGGCPDDEEPPICSKSSPFSFCILCRTPKDCALAGDAKVCDPEHKRCVQCINEFQCGFGEACNPLNQRCAKACDGNNDSCGADGQRLSCSRELGVCVSCIRDLDCAGYGLNTHCYQSVCVECFDDRQCASQSCVNGRCKP